MYVSQKCQYAVRALFELAKRRHEGPVSAALVARSQGIPQRFLEVIFGELRQGGFVAAQRGREGGYRLVKPAEELHVTDILRFVDGPLGPVGCVDRAEDIAACPLHGACVFLPMWQRVAAAIEDSLATTTLAALVAEEAEMERRGLLTAKVA